MDHPNIANVLDAGATDTGRPFFVMELVKGILITKYCDQEKLSTQARLDLFVKVCHAIQHAHQKGIIHRDIKPSNIMVTLHDGVPVPKVIDFGIAKATEKELTEKTIYTRYSQFIGTPAYTSPEQAEMSGLDIDTRSDIYSLGVLLYELLTGKTPFDAKELIQSGIDEMRRIIREEEPVRPSTRLSQTLAAEQVRTSSPHLLQELKGDLDWIVMKCLEKDRQRRYESANSLAADLKRHLNNEPVAARPPSAAYKFQKAFRRNKLVFVAGTAVCAALLLGIVLSARQAVRAKRAEARALVEKANAQAALHFIQDDVLSQANPGFQPDRELTVRTLLDRIADRLAQATGRPPLVEASIRQTLGSVYTELGDYVKAVQHYEAALRLQRQHLGENDPETLRSLHGLSMSYWWGSDMAKAEPLTRQGLEASRRVLGDKHPLTLQFMQARAFTLLYLAEVPWPDVEGLFLEALAKYREVLGRDDPATLRLTYGIGIGYVVNQQDEKGVALVDEALDRARRVLDEKHPDIAGLSALLSCFYLDLNQLEKGEALARRAVELRRQILGEENSKTINAIVILATIHVKQGRLDEARRLTDLALQTSRQLPMENSPFLPLQLGLLGWLYLEQGDLSKADTICTLTMEAMRRKPNANPMVFFHVMARLGSVRLALGQWSEAEALLRECSRRAYKLYPDTGYRFYLISLLGGSLAGQAKYAEAEPLLRQGYDGLVQRQASMPPILNAPRRVTESLDRLVQLYEAWGKPAQAAEWKKNLNEFHP
jgi:tetratricopeptide (TPR) repeat protein